MYCIGLIESVLAIWIKPIHTIHDLHNISPKSLAYQYTYCETHDCMAQGFWRHTRDNLLYLIGMNTQAIESIWFRQLSMRLR